MQKPETGKVWPAWIWFMVGLAIPCLVCLLAVVLAFLFLAPVRQQVLATVPTLLPGPPVPPGGLAVAVEPLAEAADYPDLFLLVPDWEGLSSPGENHWPVHLAPSQEVMIQDGWCASTAEVLAQNLEHLNFLLEADGQTIPETSFAWETNQESDGSYCYGYRGIVRSWPQGEYSVVQGFQLREAINDGWSDYPAGDYIDVFDIIVSP